MSLTFIKYWSVVIDIHDSYNNLQVERSIMSLIYREDLMQSQGLGGLLTVAVPVC